MRKIPYKIIRESKILAIKEKIRSLELQVDAARDFIGEIEKGNLNIDLQGHANGGDNLLASSLLKMRDQMKRIADEEKQRNWATEGLAKFVDILRTKNDDLKGLGDVIISNIIKYMEANQGSLYILNEDDPSDVHLELIACYAYDRKKHRTQRIGIGEGLVGQSFLEKSAIYMTNLPGDYLKISSGLGEALPRNLLIVPLMLNGKVYGVIEMASFTVFKKHHRDFIERLAESIASTISTVRVNQHTRKLLTETQAQTEQMRAQEEEMRQNMEELSATQEEMQRVLKEVEGKQAYVNQLLNVSSDSIFTIDKKYKLASWNKAFARSLEQFGMRLEKGVDTLDWYPGDERQKQIELYNRVLNGETFEFTAASELNGSTHYFLSIYAPLRNENGDVYEAAIFAKDITAMTLAQKNAEQLHKEASQQAEELKAQEEELRQNMEELSATQEEMQRILNEVQAKEAYLNAVLNASRDSIFTIDKDYKLISFNQGFTTGLTQMGIVVEKGFPILDLFPDEKQKNEQRAHYARAFRGEAFDVTSEFNFNGQVSFYTSSFSPLRRESGEVFAVATFGKDVTELVTSRKKAEALAEEAQQANEEMKAQEEELRQNMEEMAAQHDEMGRVMKEMESREAYATQLLNISQDLIFTIDRRYRLVSWNKTFAASLEKFGMTLEKGMNTLDWYQTGEEREQQKALYERVFKGETFESTTPSEINGATYYFQNTHSPLTDADGVVYEAAVFARDITSSISKEKAEQLKKLKKIG